jgi:hypothetical protein
MHVVYGVHEPVALTHNGGERVLSHVPPLRQSPSDKHEQVPFGDSAVAAHTRPPVHSLPPCVHGVLAVRGVQK